MEHLNAAETDKLRELLNKIEASGTFLNAKLDEVKKLIGKDSEPLSYNARIFEHWRKDFSSQVIESLLSVSWQELHQVNDAGDMVKQANK